jgi:peptide chain release factor 1
MIDLTDLEARREDLERRLASPDVFGKPQLFARLSRQLGGVSKVLSVAREVSRIQAERDSSARLADAEKDPELRALAREDVARLEEEARRKAEEFEDLLLEAHDAGDVDLGRRRLILEIRAGTGGEEASLFAADLFRMYAKFCERQGWKVEVLSSQTTDLGGFREVTAAVEGDGAYQRLRFEMGGHRVQRVPETEAQGRIHTSAATVAVLPEPEEIELVIPDKELRIDTMRAGGPGGQKVNKTESAVRITHLPTGITVHCQDEKSQHKNRDRAMRILRTRILEHVEGQRKKALDETRRTQIGSGDRNERIRTYNFPQSRITDHRINESFFNLEEILAGRLDDVVGTILARDRRDRLERLRKEGFSKLFAKG